MKAREIVEGELSLDKRGQDSFGFLLWHGWYLSSWWLFAGGRIPCFLVVIIVITVVVWREIIGSIAKDSSGRLVVQGRQGSWRQTWMLISMMTRGFIKGSGCGMMKGKMCPHVLFQLIEFVGRGEPWFGSRTFIRGRQRQESMNVRRGRIGQLGKALDRLLLLNRQGGR